jgi:hypothetical protein
MATYSKIVLSGSTNGQPIEVNSTSVGVAVHTATSGSDEMDELFLLACNNHGSAVELTIYIGGTASGQTVKISLNSKEGLVIVLPGLPLKSGVAVTAIASTANVVNLMGHVIRSVP